MSASNAVLRYLLSRDIIKGKSREELLAKLHGAGFSGEHAEQFIAQAERRVLARNRRCAVISALVVAVLVWRLFWGPHTGNDEMRLLLSVTAAIFAAAGFYFWLVARLQAPPAKVEATRVSPP